MLRVPNFLTVPSAYVAFGLLLFIALVPRVSNAHEFVFEFRAVGAESDEILTDALRGFLLATVERDGHANEASNGHLGGLDVYIIPQPASVAANFPELKQAPYDRPDIVAVIGPEADVESALDPVGGESVYLSAGRLHPDNVWATGDGLESGDFAARYTTEFGQPPSQWAARGYNIARRIEAAVRPLGGVNDRAALERAFADSAEGLRW